MGGNSGDHTPTENDKSQAVQDPIRVTLQSHLREKEHHSAHPYRFRSGFDGVSVYQHQLVVLVGNLAQSFFNGLPAMHSPEEASPWPDENTLGDDLVLPRNTKVNRSTNR